MRTSQGRIRRCSRTGHQWRVTSPAVCVRCGLRLHITQKHWQKKANQALWGER